MPRHKHEDIEWLVDEVKRLVANGATIKEACIQLSGEWETRIGRPNTIGGLQNIYSRYSRALDSDIKCTGIREGEVILFKRVGDKYWGEAASIEEAMHSAYGDVGKWEFGAMRRLHVEWKQMLVIK